MTDVRWQNKQVWLLWVSIFILTLFTPQSTQSQDPIVLQMLVPMGVVDAGYLNEQLAVFSEEQPYIEVSITEVAPQEYTAVVAATLAGDGGYDILVLTRNQAVEPYMQGFLLPIEDYTAEANVDLENFTVEGLQDITFDSLLYGLPLYRYGCAPSHINLVPLATTEYPVEVLQVIEYLTRIDQQAQNYDTFNWIPTRQPLYGELGLECDELVVLYPTPQQQLIAREVASALQDTLADVLEGQVLNVDLATLYDENPETELESPTMIVAVPVAASYTEEELLELLPEGVILGAIRVGAESPYVELLGTSGDFVVKCYGSAEGLELCELISPIEGTFTLEGVEEIPTSVEVGPTVVHFVEGSISICWWSDSRRYCWVIG